MTEKAPDGERIHVMQCTEIWGGTRVTDEILEVPGMDVHILSKPFGGDAGGDIHYVGLCGHGKLSRFVVADVAGHGRAVSELADALHALMHEHMDDRDQSELVMDLNRAFESRTDEGRFATAIIMSYLAPKRHLVTVNAGHPKPLWYRRREGRWCALTPDVPAAAKRLLDLPLGILPGTNYQQFAVPLEADDIVLVFTDSLIEVRDASGVPLGEAGLLDLVADVPTDDRTRFPHLLIEAALDYHAAPDFDDDLTLLTLCHRGDAT